MPYKYIQNQFEEENLKQREMVIDKALEIAERYYSDQIDDFIEYSIYKFVSEEEIFFGLALANTLFPSFIKIL